MGEERRATPKQVRRMERGKRGQRKAAVGYVKGMDGRGKVERRGDKLLCGRRESVKEGMREEKG